MATILIVDDQPTNRKYLVTLLVHHGHRIVEAADGKQALAVVRAEHPDLVITDVLMPVMDGYAFVRQLRLDPTIKDIPVVFYTAHYGEREARELALSSGVSDVLVKPAGSVEVLRVVRRALSGEPVVDEPAPPMVLSTGEYDRAHLRLLTDKLSEKTGDLGIVNAQLRALVNVGLELAAEKDFDRLLERVCVGANDLFGATYVTLGLTDPTHKTLLRLAGYAEGSAGWIGVGDAIPGVLATVVRERRPLRGDNVGGDPAGLRLPPMHPKIEVFLVAPISSPSDVYGWICLVGNDGKTFSEHDEDLLMALAGQVGRIYESAHSYAVAQSRAAELSHEVLERKEAEQATRRERDRAQHYLDAAEIILLALDIDGRITLVNRYACSILGWTCEELLGKSWSDTCLPLRLRETLKAQFAELLSDNLSVNENYIICRSGEERLIDWRNTVLRDDEGRVVGTLSSGSDITERTKAVEDLRIAEERMRFALDGSGVGIWDMDYKTGVLRWSHTIEAHYGLEPGAFDGKFETFVQLVHPDDRKDLLATVGKAMKSGTDFTIANRAQWPDGSVRQLNGAGRVHLGEQGEPVRGIGISMDVTERHILEEQYQQAQKMEAIGRLAGGVAHDFNNLLTAILGYCELLISDLGSSDPRRSDVVEIQKAGVRAAGLTRQLLAFSRKQIIAPTVMDLNLVVSDMRPMLARLIGEDIKIVMDLPAHLSSVKADHSQMEQIVMNLAVNARDAMPKGGILVIETADVEVDEPLPSGEGTTTWVLPLPPGPYVVLTVTDTGTGMTGEVQSRLFEPFFTTKELGKGTGLGLATVHGIVARGGGSVHVHSELGKGTAFKVYFPRADSGEVVVLEGPRSGPVLQDLQAQTILVVEDEDALRELTRRLLQRQGYTVLVAANADQALALFHTNPHIDLILTDVVMPGGSGPELTRRLVEERPELRVVYMTGYTDDAIIHHGALNSGIALLQKPFTSESLGQKLREALSQ